MVQHFIGVDVGTGSVRAGIFSETGELKQVSTKNIEINNPEPGFYQQSSEEIWAAVCETVQELLTNNDDLDMAAVAFCATCSLVAIGKDNQPVSICKTGNPKWNVMMWMDHRASAEAAEINALKHPVLSTVGGTISLEMQIPKIIWLKRNLESSYNSTHHFFDLSDYLRWRATGCFKRSICTLVCKWNFVYEPVGRCEWDKTYLEQLGFQTDDCLKFGSEVNFPGGADDISQEAATDLKLKPETKVGFSMIDAHCGLLGLIAGRNLDSLQDATSSLVLICGTSNCVMAVSQQPIATTGVWGPYYGIVLDNFYVSEGGQSASGKLVDHIVKSHPAYSSLLTLCGSHDSVLIALEEAVGKIAKGDVTISELTRDLHVFPDFHGNRSPLADTTLKGMVIGLTLSTDLNDLATLYLATLQALSYGIRHIKETLEASGHSFNLVQVCGGLVKSKLFLQTLEDVLDLQIDSTSVEPVLYGAALSAIAACTPYHGYGETTSVLNQALLKLSALAPRRQFPARVKNERVTRYHDGKYKVFLELLKDQYKYRNIMEHYTT